MYYVRIKTIIYGLVQETDFADLTVRSLCLIIMQNKIPLHWPIMKFTPYILMMKIIFG